MDKLRKYQEAIDDIRDVCRKYDIVLVGTCQDEGVYGEILIESLRNQLSKWQDLQPRITNKVEFEDYFEQYQVWGIG